MHLSPGELLDLAEGTRPLSSAPHLTTCDACRQQLDDVRGIMGTLRVDVPEPSPMFWDHLSARVRDAVAAEPVPTRSWFNLGRWWWGLAAAMSVAVVAIAVSRTGRTPPASTRVPRADMSVAPAVAEVSGGDAAGAAANVDDPSFSLLGDLAGSLDWDGAAEAGIGMAVGTADTAVAELNDGERAELRRLLREAIAPSHTGA